MRPQHALQGLTVLLGIAAGSAALAQDGDRSDADPIGLVIIAGVVLFFIAFAMIAKAVMPKGHGETPDDDLPAPFDEFDRD